MELDVDHSKLQGFVSYEVLYPSNLYPLARSELPSLLDAVAPSVLILFVVASMLFVGFELRCWKAWRNIGIAILSTFAPSCEQGADPVWRIGQRNCHYLSWTLCLGLLSSMYSNTLKSITVAPEVKVGHYSLDELLRKNVSVYAYSHYSEVTFLYGFRKLIMKNVSASVRKTLEREALLVKEISRNRGELSAKRIAEIIEKNSVAILFDKDRLKLYTKLFKKVLHKHVYVTKEQFFHVPRWWYLKRIPDSYAVLHLMQLVQEAGIEGYWLRLSRKIIEKRRLRSYRFPQIRLGDDCNGVLETRLWPSILSEMEGQHRAFQF